MGLMGDDMMLFLGHENSPINFLDNYYPFRQDSSFLYYAGLNLPHLALIIDGLDNSVHLFGDDISIDHIVWMGEQPSMEELGAKVGIIHTHPYAKLAEVIQRATDKKRTVHYLPPYRDTTVINLSKLLDYTITEVHAKPSLRFIKAVVQQREIKGPEEVAEMEKAVTVSGKMHEAVMKKTRAGIKESALVGEIQTIAAAKDCQLAYSPILTVNGHTLHNHSHHNILEKGKLVLGDFGASNQMNYAGDITRTVPVDNKFSLKQKEIYNIVLQAETAGIDAIRPGVDYVDIHLNASKVIIDGLKNLGLMKGDSDAALSAGAQGLFFPHGLGHQIGLDVHDMEDLGEAHVGYGPDYQRSTQFGLKSLRMAKALKENMVITIEPGIYFIPQLIAKWKAEGHCAEFINFDKLEAYLDFGGIRIEDDVLVTKEGSRVLGDPIPRSAEQVEALRNA